MDETLRINYEKEAQASFVDSLTGLFNHGFFQMVLAGEIKKAQLYQFPFTLALFDIDSFDAYNKFYGHAKGDRILKEVAGYIKQNLGESDLAARYSGNMFAVIMTKAEVYQIIPSIERIQQIVKTNFGGDITVSVGLASYPKDSSNASRLIEEAHVALSKAKQRGKDSLYFLEKTEYSPDEEKPKILIVDDDLKNLKLMQGILFPLRYKVFEASSAEEALSLVTTVDIDIILSDIMMPGMDGYEMCSRLKSNESTRHIPIIMLTALEDTDSKLMAIESGTNGFISKPPNKVELLARIRFLINLKKLNNNLISLENVLFFLANMFEAKDENTKGHLRRVSDLAIALGGKMHLTKEEIEALRVGGVLHDIGKIGIPTSILNKPSPLSNEEWTLIKEHPRIGYKMCLPLKKTLRGALDLILYHHEKLDGSGYPEGIKGDRIPVVARIMSVVNLYDSLASDRPYRKGISNEYAFKILRQEMIEGKLDKEVVECLIGMICK